MSFKSGLLLLGVFSAHIANAHVIDRAPEIEIVPRHVNLTDTVEIDFSALRDLSLPLAVGTEPRGASKCPATNNGRNRNYGEHRYTENQLKAAFLAGARLAADEKQIGDQHYPHAFGNNEKLPFECGNKKMEFPIRMDGSTYTGGDVGDVPDRVVFEYKPSKKDAKVNYCGVMRHGPGVAFLKC